MVKVKIGKKQYNGEIISDENEPLYKKVLVRYKLENNKHTTGWFNVDDVTEITFCENINNDKRITDNYKIQCTKCRYITVVEKKENGKYGYCPNCMCKKFIELEYVGTY